MVVPILSQLPVRFRVFAFLVVAILLILPHSTSLGQVCEPPLFVVQSSGGANVMILCDSSGSMNEVILHDDYDGDVDYPGRFSSKAIISVI